MSWLLLAIVVVMLGGALAALLVRSHVAAVASVSSVSLGLSVLFVVLRAPDVAMTEAAVGAGLSSVILALALGRLGLAKLEINTGDEEEQSR
ncbi:MAG: Na(+)/H(+) antiporter subunit B [Gammaproteobacteria bacterium]